MVVAFLCSLMLIKGALGMKIAGSIKAQHGEEIAERRRSCEPVHGTDMKIEYS